MVTKLQIRELCARIVRAFHPGRIILFGSYGYGQPTEDSDVDLLVILSGEEHGPRKSWEILSETNPSFPVDLLVRTPEQVQYNGEWP
jgi:predicted nucleotidyltransferase